MHLARLSLIALFLVMHSGCVLLGPLERSVIYHPTAYPDDFKIPPDAPLEEAWFQSPDGIKIHGLFAEHKNPKAVALVCHGNAGNVADRVGSMSILHSKHQLSVLMFDYRGYGKSEGKPYEKGILADARAARKWLAQRTGVKESEIIIMGRSLGGAVAIDLASQDGAKAVVVASTFPSLPEIAKHHFKLLPADWIMSERLDSIAKIKNYHGPLLQSHGTTDTLIPIEFAKALFDAAPGPKTFIQVDGGHNAPQSPEYRDALEELLNSLD